MAKKKLELGENSILRGRKFRFYPDEEHRKKINGTLGACRVCYNLYVGENQRRYNEEKAREKECEEKGIEYEKQNTFIPYMEFSKEITRLRKDPQWEWLTKYSSTAERHAVQDAEHGYLTYFKMLKKENYDGFLSVPQIKAKKTIRNSSFYIAKSDGIRFNIDPENPGLISIPSIGKIMVKEPEYLPDIEKVKSGRVCRDGEYYFVTFSTEIEKSQVSGEGGIVNVYLGRDKNDPSIIGIIESDDIEPFQIHDPKRFDNWLHQQYRIDKFKEAFANKTSINSQRYQKNYKEEYKEEPDTSSKKMYHSMSYISNRMCKLRAKESKAYTKQANIESNYYNNVVAKVVQLEPSAICITRPSSKVDPETKKRAAKGDQEAKKIVARDYEERFFKLVQKFQAQCEEYQIELVIENKEDEENEKREKAGK